MNCICCVCFKPNDTWLTFLSTFKMYDIYIIVDDNSKDYKELYSNFKNINIIQINNEDCKINGFRNMNFLIFKKEITGWDKAIYYFSIMNTKYKNVWVFEDDVFFHSEQTLLNIDTQFGNSDLLSNSYGENIKGTNTDWLWHAIDIKIPPPYYCAMVCCIRLSHELLNKIKEYAKEYKTLFFLEALFPTLCKQHNLLYHTPKQFHTICWRKDYAVNEINISDLFHPIKDMNHHIHYRSILNNS